MNLLSLVLSSFTDSKFLGLLLVTLVVISTIVYICMSNSIGQLEEMNKEAQQAIQTLQLEKANREMELQVCQDTLKDQNKAIEASKVSSESIETTKAKVARKYKNIKKADTELETYKAIIREAAKPIDK